MDSNTITVTAANVYLGDEVCPSHGGRIRGAFASYVAIVYSTVEHLLARYNTKQ